MKNLVIVESPTKSKKIEEFLGADYIVLSSGGHIRDLSKKEMSIDIDNQYEPRYMITEEKHKLVADLKRAVKEAETVWLASDEDREGEAIAWHLQETLKLDPASHTQRHPASACHRHESGGCTTGSSRARPHRGL